MKIDIFGAGAFFGFETPSYSAGVLTASSSMCIESIINFSNFIQSLAERYIFVGLRESREEAPGQPNAVA